MKRLLYLLSIFILFCPVGAVFADSEHPYEYKSATEYDFPPFSVTENGIADGFSVALLKAVADEMDLNITFKVDQWNTIKGELEEGKLDVLPLVAYNEERDKVFDFSAPYIILNGNIFVRTNDNTIKSEDDLYGKDIIVMRGDSMHEFAVKKGYSDHLILTDTYADAFKLLSSGKYDAVLTQSIVGQRLIAEHNIKNVHAVQSLADDGITELATKLDGFELKFCFAVQEGNAGLLAHLNEGLAIVISSGKFTELYNEWFPFLVNKQLTLAERLRQSLIIIIPVIIIVLIIAFILVERLIAKKTKQLQDAQKAVLSMEASIRNKQKLESIGTLASGIAHEINNPLNGIMNYGQLILDSKDKEKEVDAYANEIINETKRIAEVTKSLLQFSRQEKRGYSRAKIKDIIDRTLALIDVVLKRDQIKLSVHIPEKIPDIHCRYQQIQQVLLNILANARDSLNEKYPDYNENKQINISCKPLLRGGKRYVRITVEDTGTGISRAVQEKMYDPFFSTHPKDKRTGLGLSISYGIVEEHRGMLTYQTKPGQFTRFHIDLLIHPS